LQLTIQTYQLQRTIAKNTTNRKNVNIPVTGNKAKIPVTENNAKIPATKNNAKLQQTGTIHV